MMPRQKKFIVLLICIVIVFMIFEIFLRAFHPSHIKSNRIILKANQKKIHTVINAPLPGLDSTVIIRWNSMGFRGEEPPEDWDKWFTIITVGGSTTECFDQNEGKTWPDQLGAKLKTLSPKTWINNAGMIGCSTYGHAILLDDYLIKLKPDMILFFIGIDDRGRKDTGDFENETGFLADQKESLIRKLFKKIETFVFLTALYRGHTTWVIDLAEDTGSGHSSAGSSSPQSFPDTTQILDHHRQVLPYYRERVKYLVKRCLDNGIEPGLITHPMLVTPDPLTWKIMELYNEVSREVASEYGILLIDLERKLEKKQEYFYDHVYFINAGCEAAAEIMFQEMNDYYERSQKYIF